MQQRVSTAADNLIQTFRSEERPLRDILIERVGLTRFVKTERKLAESISEKITEGIISMNVGNLLMVAVNKKFNEKMYVHLGMKILPMLNISEKTLIEQVNEVVAAQAPDIVRYMVMSAEDRLLNAPVKDLTTDHDAQIQSLRALLIQHYSEVVRAILNAAFVNIDLGAIIEQEILKITPEQLEAQLTGLLKREIFAIKGLFALLGMVVGFAGALMAAWM